ncbi:MAG: hypothetical protein COS15_02850 [Caldiserica bacterium CG02_land_8_20_14_3_00_36_38]|nr:MAG: hypothetical protein AUJ99_02420 [Caldisericum sp. CG2_30_36_11]PIV55788.1 MAG: hypothetical protein COS15_02850 [Caldiserica bacterium CG02_land_8_20_14_3_00_36_38]
MGQKQVNLLFKVLKILQKEGVLKHLVVAGSWCLYFYQFYFEKQQPIASLRTRDVDFLIPEPSSIKLKINLPDLLKDLGFVTDFRGEEGYIRLIHPEFFIEFLVPEKGRSFAKTFPLPQLGMNAQALRFMDILYLETITLKVQGVKIKLPHPACFLLHKIIIYTRRPEVEKRAKEIEQINRMLDFLTKEDEFHSLKMVFLKLHKKWRIRVINNLKNLNKKEIIDILQ